MNHHSCLGLLTAALLHTVLDRGRCNVAIESKGAETNKTQKKATETQKFQKKAKIIDERNRIS